MLLTSSDEVSVWSDRGSVISWTPCCSFFRIKISVIGFIKDLIYPPTFLKNFPEIRKTIALVFLTHDDEISEIVGHSLELKVALFPYRILIIAD